MTQTPSDVEALLRLQTLVLALGESKHHEWWKCNFLSPTGLSFLQRLYPRTYFWTAVQSSSVAACTVHDSAIGIGNVYHLFRLPREIDRSLREHSAEEQRELAAELIPALGDKTRMIELLKKMAEGQPTQPQAGPVKLGTVQDLLKPDYLIRMASLYSVAFLNGAKTFPYFEGKSSGK